MTATLTVTAAIDSLTALAQTPHGEPSPELLRDAPLACAAWGYRLLGDVRTDPAYPVGERTRALLELDRSAEWHRDKADLWLGVARRARKGGRPVPAATLITFVAHAVCAWVRDGGRG